MQMGNDGMKVEMMRVGNDGMQMGNDGDDEDGE